MPRLDGAAIDLNAFRAQARDELLAMLRSVGPAHRTDRQGKAPTGSLALVLDPSLSGPLGLVGSSGGNFTGDICSMNLQEPAGGSMLPAN